MRKIEYKLLFVAAILLTVYYVVGTKDSVSAQSTFTFIEWADTRSGTSYLSSMSNYAKSNNNPVFTIYPGDLVDSFSGINTWKNAINGGSSPGNGMFDITFPTRGNHDGGESTWQQYFNLHSQASNISGISNYNELTEDLVYSFDYANVRIIGLDIPGDVMSNALTAAEKSWLNSRLSDAQARSNIDHVFIDFHGPIYCCDGHCSGCTTQICTRDTGSSALTDLINILDNYSKVSATFHGHEHLYDYTHMDASRNPNVDHQFEHFIGGAGGMKYNDLSGMGYYCHQNRYDYYMQDTDGSPLRGYLAITVSGKNYSVKFYSIDSSKTVRLERTMNFTNGGTALPTSTPGGPTLTNTPTPTRTPTPTQGIGPTSTPYPTPPDRGSTYNSVEDTSASSGYASSNYGSNSTVTASDYYSTDLRTVYLKFKLPSGTNITGAKLELTAQLARSVEKYVYTTDNSWSESSLTYNNRPTKGTQVGYLNHLSSTLNVGEVVTIPLDASKLLPDSQGYISFIIDNAGSGNTFEFSSKEGSSPPRLVINSSGTLPTPTSGGGQPCSLPGDASGDGKVTGVDYVIWLNHYNQTTTRGCVDGDFSGDNHVTGVDYVIWLNNYGSLSTASTPTATQNTGSGFTGISNGQTVSGLIYVTYEADSSITQSVQFYIDGNSERTESIYPYALAGDTSSGVTGYDTNQLANGQHSLSVTVTRSDSSTYNDQLVFTVNNTSSNPTPTNPPNATSTPFFNPTSTPSTPLPTLSGSFPNPPSGSTNDCGGFWCALDPPYRLSNGQVGFDPRRIPIELQAWWLPSYGHIHWAANLPVGQKVSGNMNFNIRIVMHDNPSTFHSVEVYDENHNRPWYVTNLNRVCTDPSTGATYDGSKSITCAYNFNASVNTNNLTNQWHEFRLRQVQHTLDGNEFLNSSAVPFQIDNGTTSDTAHSNAVTGQMLCNHPITGSTHYSSIAGRGWYTDAGYTVGVIDCVPLTALSKSAYPSGYTFWVRASQETSSRLVVDMDKSHPVPATGPWGAVRHTAGITLLDRAGNITTLQPVLVDLRKLQNGWHSIAARSDDSETHFTSCNLPLICNRDNRTSGIAKIWFFVTD